MKILFFYSKTMKIYKHKRDISIFEVINKNGDYNFDDKLITLKENLFFQKIN